MGKKVVAQIKMELHGGWATPAPPVGPALGQYGVNIGAFCNRFNNQTAEQQGDRLPVVITVFDDQSFTFVVRQPTAAFLLKRAVGIAKGSGEPNTKKVGSITQRELTDIASIKMPDLSAASLEAAERIIAGTARSMGIEIVP